MDIRSLIIRVHKRIETKEIRDISKREMAEKIGVSERTYIEYGRGGNAPLAMKAILNLLSELDETELIQTIKEWKSE